MYGCHFCHRKFRTKLLSLKINGKNISLILVYDHHASEFYGVSVRSYAPIIVTRHLPQVGHGWGLLGICKSHLTNSPPLGPISCCKSPTFCIGTSKNNEDSWTNAPTLGTKYADKSLQIPTRCPTWVGGDWQW